jgi:hypothetical protein
MKLINFLVWLSAGAFIGWFARRMVDVEHRQILKTGQPVKVSAPAID